MFQKDGFIVVGSLAYGEILPKWKKNLLLILIILPALIFILSLFAVIFFFNASIGSLIFLVLCFIWASVLITISAIYLKKDYNNKKYIAESLPDAVLLNAVSEVTGTQWNGSVRMSVRFGYSGRHNIIKSDGYIRIGAGLKNRRIRIFYNPTTNFVMLVKAAD